MLVTSKAPRKAQVLPPAPQLMTFSAFSVWQVDPTLPHQQQAVPPNYSPAGTCRGQNFPQEDEQVFLGAKSVIQSCYDLTSYPDEEKLPVKKTVIKALGISNRGEPLEVTFLSIQQETHLEQNLVVQAYFARV